MAKWMMSLFLFVNVQVLGSTYQLRTMSMFSVDNPYTTLLTSTPTLITYMSIPSIIKCAAICLEQNKTCSAIAFEPSSNKCSIGICAISQPVTRSPSVNIYQVQPAPCNSTPGFNVETNGNTSACLWWSTTQKEMIKAREDCEAMGSILATFKTLKKFQILQRKAYTIFIGLDDIETEGVYRWHDDGSILDNTLMQQIFPPGEPNNYLNVEDCIALRISLLNDFPCYSPYNYVCEKICFQ